MYVLTMTGFGSGNGCFLETSAPTSTQKRGEDVSRARRLSNGLAPQIGYIYNDHQVAGLFFRY